MKISVTSKGRIVIPVSLRRKFGIEKGTAIVVSDNGEQIILKPITKQYIKKLRGSLRGTGALKSLMKVREKDQ